MKHNDLPNEKIALSERIAELEAQLVESVEQRQLAERALAGGNDRFRVLFETMSLGVVYQDALGSIIAANPAAEQILGLSLDQMQGRKSVDPRWRAIHEDGSDFPGKLHPASLALLTGKPVHEVVMGVFQLQKEAYSWILIDAIPEFRAGETRPYQVYTTFRDITKNKKTEAAHLASEARFRTAFECSPIAGGIIRASDFVIVQVNSAFTDLFGYENQQIMGHTSLEMDFWSSLEDRAGFAQLVKADGHIRNFETLIRKKSGGEVPVLMSAEQIEIDGEKGVLVQLLDLTERNQTKQKLQTNLLNMQLAAAAGGVGLWDWNISKDELTWDDTMYILYGLSKEDFGGVYQAWTSTLHPDDRQFVNEEMQAAVRGEREYTPEFRIVRPNGTIRVIKATSRSLHDQNGKAVRILGTNIDITDQKQASEKLRLSEKRFSTAFENSPIAVSISRVRDSMFTNVNSALIDLLGYSREQILGHTALELGFWASLEDRNGMLKILMAEGHLRNFETMVRSKAGGEIPVIMSAELIELEGEAYSLLQIVDISDRKLAYENLRLSEKRFSAIFESSPIAVSISRVRDAIITDVNSAFMDLLGRGRSREQILGHTANEFGIWARPDDRDEMIKKLLTEGHVRDFETLLRSNSDGEVPVLISAELLDIEGEQYSLHQIVDISERKQAQEALRLSEERFSKAFSFNSVAMSLTRQSDHMRMDANESFLEMTGLERDEIVGNSFGGIHIFTSTDELSKVKILLSEKKIIKGNSAKVTFGL